EVVEDDDALAGVGQRVHHVAADVAGAAGHQDGHGSLSLSLRSGQTSARLSNPGYSPQFRTCFWRPCLTAGIWLLGSAMANVLFIKTSSLGDVIHHMPALVEARRRRPDARIAWVVEEAFAPLARLHPAVDEVIPVASRRW